jgi:YlmC/YmxH family sporulation protein
MLKMSTSELRELEVINLCGGTKLGYPCDFEIDTKNARIISVVVCSCEKTLFSKKDEYIIPWQMIECIGEDAILVRLTSDELSSCCASEKIKGKKKRK